VKWSASNPARSGVAGADAAGAVDGLDAAPPAPDAKAPAPAAPQVQRATVSATNFLRVDAGI